MPISLESLRAKALELGFDDIGITKAQIPQEEITSYKNWLKKGYQANMAYMENEMRCFPQEFFPGAKSAILFISYYKHEKASFQENTGVVASYARGRDYHNVHRKRLKKFIAWLEETTGEKGIAKGFSDSAPVMEKALAVQAGLGWLGKNTLLIHRRFGTFFLLAGCFTTLTFPETQMETRLPRCGVCTKCLDSCPTQALVSPYHLDAQRCLSYQLIENRGELSEVAKEKNPGYIFGCDICQDVCPHNVRTALSTSPDFSEERGVGPYLDGTKVAEFEKHPEKLYGTPLTRQGPTGLRRNWESQVNSSPKI